MIHVVGNSHVRIFDGVPGFTTYWMGPTIAYNFYEHHLPNVLAYLDQNKVPTRDKVMFVVGEVDCRWHLPKQADLQGRDIIDVVYECVDRYFRSLLAVQKLGYGVIAWGAHPSTTGPHNDDSQNPVYGDCLYRNNIAIIYNSRLQWLCRKHNMKYVDIFHDLVNDAGITDMNYFLDYCHLDPTKVKQFYEPLLA